MDQLSYALTLFLSLLITSLPFLLLGIFVSSCLLVLIDEHQLVAKFPRNPILGAIVGSSIGMILPVSQYGCIPVTRRLILQKVPLSVAMSFLVAAPTVNPIVIWSTWQAFPSDGSIVFYRVVLAWLMAVMIGLIFSTHREKPISSDPSLALDTPPIETRSSLLHSGTLLLPPNESQPLHRVGNLVYEYPVATMANQPLSVTLNLFLENVFREILGLGSVLVTGCAITAITQVFVSQAELLSWGVDPLSQILVMILLGVLLSLGSPFNGFFLNALAVTFLKGSLLGFLLFSSFVDLKSVGLLFFVFRPKIVIYLLGLMFLLTFFWSVLLNFHVS